VIATVVVLQALEGLSDREAISALRRDVAWKLARGGRAGRWPATSRSPHHRLSDQPVRIGKLQQAPRIRDRATQRVTGAGTDAERTAKVCVFPA
jgi:hypothetical protein